MHIIYFPWQHSNSKENSILLPQDGQIPLQHKKMKDASNVNYGIKKIYVQGNFIKDRELLI